MSRSPAGCLQTFMVGQGVKVSSGWGQQHLSNPNSPRLSHVNWRLCSCWARKEKLSSVVQPYNSVLSKILLGPWSQQSEAAGSQEAVARGYPLRGRWQSSLGQSWGVSLCHKSVTDTSWVCPDLYRILHMTHIICEDAEVENWLRDYFLQWFAYGWNTEEILALWRKVVWLVLSYPPSSGLCWDVVEPWALLPHIHWSDWLLTWSFIILFLQPFCVLLF